MAPVPDVVNVRSPFEGALIVDPVMARSPMSAPPPPLIVIVFVAPVPDAVTPEPTKLRVVPAVDSAEPSSCTVIPLPPPEAARTTAVCGSHQGARRGGGASSTRVEGTAVG